MDKEINSNGVKNKMLIGFIIAVIVVGVGFFYGGMQYGKSQNSNSRKAGFINSALFIYKR